MILVSSINQEKHLGTVTTSGNIATVDGRPVSSFAFKWNKEKSSAFIEF